MPILLEIFTRLGEEEWVRARHAEGALTGINGIQIGVNSSIFNIGGLLSIAVLHDRPGMLALLLDLGLEPDERIRVDGMDEILYTAGNPLLSCVVLGKRQMGKCYWRGVPTPTPTFIPAALPYSAPILKRIGILSACA